jgi:hypothetical protein
MSPKTKVAPCSVGASPFPGIRQLSRRYGHLLAGFRPLHAVGPGRHVTRPRIRKRLGEIVEYYGLNAVEFKHRARH